jgi:hypothetical protein
MRIKVIQKAPVPSIDGLQLDRFALGSEYEVGNCLAALMLAEGWATPVPLEEPSPIVPFSETDPFAPVPYHDADAPPNLIREHYPPYLDDGRVDVATSFRWRRRRRHANGALQRKASVHG